MEAKESIRIIDSLNDVSNNFPTTSEKIFQGLTKSSSTANAMNMTFDETVAVLGTLTGKMKQSGNEIGNFLKSSLPRLVGKPAQDAMDSLGVSLSDKDGNLRSVIEVYTEIANKIQNISELEQIAVVEGLAGKYHIARMQTLLDDLGSADSMYKKMYETSINSSGSAERENEIYMKSLQARINSARVEVEKFAVALGEAFLTEGMIAFLTTSANVLQGMTKLVNAVGALPIIMATVGAGAVILSKRMNGLASAIIYKSTSLTRAAIEGKKYTATLNQTSLAGKRMTIATSTTAVATRTLAVTKAEATARIERFNASLVRAQAEATKATVATKALSVAGQTLKTAFLFALPLVAIGYLTEKIVSATTKSRELKEEAISANKEILNSYVDNRNEIQKLMEKYSELSSKQKELEGRGLSLDTSEYEELVRIQNELGELMPSIVKSETEYGDKVLQSHTQIETKVALLEQELALQEKLNKAREAEQREENEEVARDTIADGEKSEQNNLKDAYDYLHKMESVSKNYAELRDSFTKGISIVDGNSLKNVEDVEKAIKKVNDALANKDDLKLTDGAVRELESAKSGLEGIYTELLQAQTDVISGMNTLKENYASDLSEMLNANEDFSEKGKETFENIIVSVARMSETETDLNNLESSITTLLASKDNGVVQDFNELSKVFEITNKTSAEDFKDISDNADKLKEKINETLTLSGMDSTQIESIMEVINSALATQKEKFEEAAEYAEKHGVSMEEASAAVTPFSENSDDAKEKVDSLADVMYKLDDAIEQMAGVSQKGVEALDNLVWQYEALSNQVAHLTEEDIRAIYSTDELTTEQLQLKNALESREAIMAQLATVYPELLTLDSQAVGMSAKKLEAIKKENEANKTLLRAYKLSRDGKLTAEQDATLASATATQERIRLIREEMNALIALSTAYEKMANAQIKLDDGENLSHNEQMALMYGSKFVANGTSAEIAKLNSELNTQLTNINSLASEIDVYSDLIEDSAESTKESTKATEENTKATKENAKEQSELEKITGKYATTLNKLNTALKEVESRKKKYPTYSAGYRKALEDENRLLQNQIDLRNQESEALKNVPQTVQVEYSSNSTTPTSQQSSYNGKLNGWNGVITDQYASKRSNGTHNGIDIDGKIGDRLDANVSGTVDFAGDAAKLGGRSWEYGNLVIIKDKDNNKHYYAHMDNVSVIQGQQIEAGTQIGAIGNTGKTSKGKGGDGSHLHYEVRNSSNKHFNPNSYVTNAKNNVVPVYATTTTTPLKSNSTQDMVWNYFKQKGLSDEAVAGIMGNVMQESKFNTSAVNKRSGASGLFQWQDSRKTDLLNYAKSVGKSWTDLQVQLDFAWKELQGNESKSLNSLKGNYSASQHAANFDKQFERSAGTEVKQRQQYATQFLGQYQGSGYSANGVVNGTYTATNPDYATAQQGIERNNQANLADQEQMAENDFNRLFTSTTASFQRDREKENDLIAEQSALQEGMVTHSKEYEDSLNKQYNAEQRKVKSLENEEAIVQRLIDSGQFNEAQVDAMIDYQARLKQEKLESQNASATYKSGVINTRLERFEVDRNGEQAIIDKEEQRQKNMLTHTKAYEDSLNKQYTAEQRKLKSYQDEAKYLQHILATEELSSAEKERHVARLNELNVLAQESFDNSKEYYNGVINSRLSRFDNQRNDNNNTIDQEEAKLGSLDKTSEQYINSLDKIRKTKQANLKVDEDELAYIEKQLKAGNLTAEMYEYLNDRANALKASIPADKQDVSNQALRKLDVYDARRNAIDNTINYENAKLNEVDTNSNRYILTLQKVQQEMQKKQAENKKELEYLDEQIKSGEHSGEVLENMKQQYADLTTAVKNLATELKSLNFDIIVNINTRMDEKIDDKEFSLQRSKIIQSMYDVGSADYMREYDYQLKTLKELEALERSRIAQLQTDMKNVDLLPADIKKINEDLENATIAMYNYQKEALDTQKALDETLKNRGSDVANSLIDSIKDYYSERKDATNKAYDDEMKAESERHEKIIKNLEEENKKFKDNIDERLKLIDRTEADRDYNMDINDSMTERNKIQAEINKLSLDDSREAKSKRKKLQEQLDEIDKAIEEKRHDRQIELQKQGLNDLVELKDEEIEKKVEAENEYNESEIKRIEDLKEYWNQYYDDLLNDERKFQKIRDDIVNGNFNNIRREFGGFLDWLEDTMPDLENTLDGTMSAVGTTIRQNIIDNLNEAITLMNKLNSSNTAVTEKYGSSQKADKQGENFTNPDPTKNSNGMNPLNEADLKVLLAKYMTEVVTKEANTDARKANIREKAYALASEGRKEGSTISATTGLEEILRGLGEDDIKKLSSYASSNFGGLTTPEYQNMIKEWANKMRNGAASLDSGGMLNFKGSGIDGKGGRLIIGHPNEVVNNPIDTQNLIDHSNMMMQVGRMFTPILQAFKSPTSLLNNLTNNGGDTFIVDFNVGEMIANKETANTFGNDILNALKTKRGMR